MLHPMDGSRSRRGAGSWLRTVPWLALLLTVLLALALALCSGPPRAPSPDPYPFPLAGASLVDAPRDGP